MKVDLHCHSKWSKRPTLWIMQKLGCPESFTEPVELYEIARRKGMDYVTITDHNVIDGALEIAHLPYTFIGCEYTTYFPEDKCKVHVLLYGQTEAQHKEINEARKNIFDLVNYAHDHNLRHVCAHPLFWVNDRLTMGHVEQLILLFKNWEINADMTSEMNDAIYRLIGGLTKQDIERLSDKHGITPAFERPWEKNFTAGSDDHSSLHLANGYTHVSGAETLHEFWDGVNSGQAKVHAPSNPPEGFARNVYGIAYQFYKNRFDLERYAHRDVFLHFLEKSLQTRPENLDYRPKWYDKIRTRRRAARERSFNDQSLFQMARFEAERHILDDPRLMAVVRSGQQNGANPDTLWYEFVTEVSNKVLTQFGKHVLNRVLNGRIIDLFQLLGSAGALYAILAPYFVSFSLHRKERIWSDEILGHFNIKPKKPREPRVGHFTDTFNEVNGVALTIQQHLETAQELGKHYDVITCFKERGPRRRGIHQFSPVGAVNLPEYPEIELLTPPFLQMLKHCYEEEYTHLHVATPGPVGLAGLGVARILRLPISGTYHTAIPQYGKVLTGDAYVEEVLWKFMIWFYNQLDSVYVPSRATGDELVERGIAREKIKTYPRGCDIDRFHPSKANGIFAQQFGATDDAVNFIYVGRVSKEKNLDILSEAYRLLLDRGLNVRLIVVGDGPYLEEMKQDLADTPAIFTGYRSGDELPTLYASSDVFVFPSTTDTFGNVIVEAQASGLPVICTDQGGPHENMIGNQTGFVVPGKNATALAGVMDKLARDEDLRNKMAQEARGYMETRHFRTAFEQLYNLYVDAESTFDPNLDIVGIATHGVNFGSVANQ